MNNKEKVLLLEEINKLILLEVKATKQINFSGQVGKTTFNQIQTKYRKIAKILKVDSTQVKDILSIG